MTKEMQSDKVQTDKVQTLGEFLFENDATVPMCVNLGWNEYCEMPDWWQDFSVYYNIEEAIEVFGLTEELKSCDPEEQGGLCRSYYGHASTMFLGWVQTHCTGWLAYVEICMRQDICVHPSGDRLSYVAADHKYISWVYADTMPELEASIHQSVTDKAMEMTMKQSNWVPGEWEKWEKVLLSAPTMIRARFKVNFDDPRPVVFPTKHPYWVTGFSVPGADDWNGYATVVAYVDSAEEIIECWPDGKEIDILDSHCKQYEFSDRFPRPEWLPQA